MAPKLYEGQRVQFFRAAHPFGPVIHGYVTALTGDEDAPAKVRNNGHIYIPRAEDYVEPQLRDPKTWQPKLSY